MGKLSRALSADGLDTMDVESMTGAADAASAALVMELEAQVRKLRLVVGRAQDMHHKQEMALTTQQASLQHLEDGVTKLRGQHRQVQKDWIDAQEELQQSRTLRNDLVAQQRSLGEEIAKLKRETNDLEYKRVQMQLDKKGKQQFNQELEVLLERVRVQRDEEDRNNEEKRRQLQHMRDQEKALKAQLDRLRLEKRQP